MLANLKALGSSMSLKLHFLNSRLSYFLENLCAAIEEEGEKDPIRIQRKWNRGSLPESVECQHGSRQPLDAVYMEEPQAVQKRKSSKRSFKKKRYYTDF